MRGPDKPQQVRQISGRVKDSDGKAVSGAQVLMQDSSGHKYDTTSDGDGGYQFTSSDSKPITPGAISVGAAKDGFDPVAVTVQGGAGQDGERAADVRVEAWRCLRRPPRPRRTPPARLRSTKQPIRRPRRPRRGCRHQHRCECGQRLRLAALHHSRWPSGRRRRRRDRAGADAPQGQRRRPRRRSTTRTVVCRRAPVAGIPTPRGWPRRSGPGRRRHHDRAELGCPVDVRRADHAAAAGAGGGRVPRPVRRTGHAADLRRRRRTQYGSPTQYGANAYGGPPAVPTQGGGYDDGYGASPTGAYGRPPAPTDAGYGAQPQQRYDEPTGMYRPQDQGYDQGGYRQEPEYHAGRAWTSGADRCRLPGRW